LGIAGGIGAVVSPFIISSCRKKLLRAVAGQSELRADVVIAGGGLGGCAAALAALRNGLSVVMTEETDWVGGQLTQQCVPPDEHQWIETQGATQLYRTLRTNIRQYYRSRYPLTAAAAAQQYLNPGNGWVSRLCCEPKVAQAVLREMLEPYIASGQLTLLTEHKAAAAEVDGDRVRALTVKQVRSEAETVLVGAYFIDATELGDLLPMTGTEYVAGAEAQAETGELHAFPVADPLNQQAFTVCFALTYDRNGVHTIQKPAEYDFWRNFVPPLTPPWSGKLFDLAYCNPRTLERRMMDFHPDGGATTHLNWWTYRRVIDKNNFTAGTYSGDITIVNWPQNDYMLGNLDGTDEEFAQHVARAKQLNLSLLYWLQTEAPRPGGGYGWPGLMLLSSATGTDDGMAKYPYVRESRRIKAEFTVLEEHVGRENRLQVSGRDTAPDFFDSVGVGYYPIDLHPSTQGNNCLDFDALQFQIPLGALLPKRMENLLPANKNIGTTHLTNGCFRLHPVEWNIGEAAGMLAVYACRKKTAPRAIRHTPSLLEDFQHTIQRQGIQTAWRS
jgi:glycine/D-amino acid oxidase-like deaminating enzyme